jgi:hypothetical protein
MNVKCILFITQRFLGFVFVLPRCGLPVLCGCLVLSARRREVVDRGVSPYSYSLRAGRSGDRILAEARFSAPVHTGPGAHPALCTMGTGVFFPAETRSGRGVNRQWLKKEQSDTSASPLCLCGLF